MRSLPHVPSATRWMSPTPVPRQPLARRWSQIWGLRRFWSTMQGVTRDGLCMRMKEEDWETVLDTNLKGAFNMVKALQRPLLKSGSGRIINISSVIGLIGNAGQCNYAASKAGLIGLTKSLAREFARQGRDGECDRSRIHRY